MGRVQNFPKFKITFTFCKLLILESFGRVPFLSFSISLKISYLPHSNLKYSKMHLYILVFWSCIVGSMSVPTCLVLVVVCNPIRLDFDVFRIAVFLTCSIFEPILVSTSLRLLLGPPLL